MLIIFWKYKYQQKLFTDESRYAFTKLMKDVALLRG